MAGELPLTSGQAAEKKTEVASILALLRKAFVFDENMLPAIIEQYDRNNNIATVRPLIQWIDVDGNGRRRQPLANIPVLSIGGGGFHISFPLGKGDLGWIVASDRDISQFKQALSESKPQTGRLHKFEDALFIPDVFRKYVINGEDEGAMVVQAVDGSARVSIRQGGLKLTAAQYVTIEAPLTTVDGDLTVTGKSTLKDTEVNGIDVSSHGHMETNNGRTAGGMIE